MERLNVRWRASMSRCIPRRRWQSKWQRRLRAAWIYNCATERKSC